MTNIAKLEDTGERMVPEYNKGTLIYAEHITRYQAVLPHVKDKVVLDIASGSGYGTALLASSAKHVFGVDVDEPAVEYAKQQYAAKNITYKIGNGEKIPLDDNSVEVVVTFETIEHVKNYKKFLKEVKRVLKPDGLAIISTPNELEFAEGNHFHLHEFKYDELHKLLKAEFKQVDPYYQATWKAVALGGSDAFLEEGIISASIQNLAPIKPDQYLYFFMICSNEKTSSNIETVVALGDHFSERQRQTQLEELSGVITELRRIASDQQKKISEQSEKIQELHTTLQHVRNSLQQLQNSLSWKITKPLRSISTGLRNNK